MLSSRVISAAIIGIALMLAGAPNASAVPVDLELGLLMDVSGSVDASDFALQVNGYAAAFANPALVTAIQSGAIGAIAVSIFQFHDNAAQVIPWTLINDGASATAFSAAVAGMGRIGSGQTNILDGINVASASMGNNDFEGTRQVIDISGDGAQSVSGCAFSDLNCLPLQAARDAFLLGGANRTINALWINDRDFFGNDMNDLINAFQYGNLNVIGGPGAFQDLVQNFEEFEGAIDRKLIREVRVPEPGMLLLLGGALLGLAASRKRRS